MKSINNWNDVRPATDGFETVPVGAYICQILRCEEKPNKNNGGTHLEIWFDIAVGEWKGFFTSDYMKQTGENKYWRGTIYQNVPDENSDKYNMQCGFFKRFINAIEESNEGYHWDWNEELLKGKRIGVVFGEVERESKSGTRYMTTRPDNVVSTKAVEENKFRLPKTKYLPVKQEAPETSTFEEINDGELPF